MNPNRSSEGERLIDGATRTVSVLGGGHLGVAVARRLQEGGQSVTLVDELSPAEHPGLPESAVVNGDPAERAVLAEAGVSEASRIIVATPSDSRNLLIAQLVRANFGDLDVVVLTNVPDRFDSIEQAGHEPVCATAALSDALVENA